MTGIIAQIVQRSQAIADTASAMSENLTGMEGELRLSILDLIMKGGWIMLPLAILSLIAIYIFFERFFILNRASKEDRNFMNNIRDFVHDGRIDSANALCKSYQTPISRMIEKGIARIGKPLNDINAAIENVGKLEVAKLEKNIAGLATIAGVSPMIGFLGTVIGMVKAFYDMSMAGNNIDIQLLSTGIYQAMMTTVAGLVVGIVAYICYNILVARVEKIVFMLEARATEFMDLLHEPVK